MQIEECPHCFTRVVPTGDNECPACRKSLRDVKGTDASKISLAVMHGGVLPPYCCDCGQATKRYVTVRSTIPGEGGTGCGAGFAVVLSAIFGVFVIGDDDQPRRRSRDTIVARIPQCERCAALKKPEPIRANPQEQHMTLVVHKDFQQRVVEERSSG